jgi:hypothetical protein
MAVGVRACVRPISHVCSVWVCWWVCCAARVTMKVFELPPHVFAIANEAYYQMKEETTDQCILISGESVR